MNAMRNITKKRKPYKPQQGGKKNGTRAKKQRKKEEGAQEERTPQSGEKLTTNKQA
jgi:hypothetical protein